METINGKAIYSPKGKAGEYAEYACNFYVGCSNGCEYCYCKKGILAGVMGGDRPTLKKCFKNDLHAWEIFMREVTVNLKDLQQHGLFFSFTTDPMLPDTKDLTIDAIAFCVKHNVPVKILTKCTEWLEIFLGIIEEDIYMYNKKNLIAFGFTLTGHDELEKGAATNDDRIRAMKVLSNEGFKTFASIEPIIDFKSSLKMINETVGYCDLYKIGLAAGQKIDSKFNIEMVEFVGDVNMLANLNDCKVYWKESIRKRIYTYAPNCVEADYNMFTGTELQICTNCGKAYKDIDDAIKCCYVYETER